MPLLLSLPVLCNATRPTEIYTLSLHDALPISITGAAASDRDGATFPIFITQQALAAVHDHCMPADRGAAFGRRSEEHTSELQSLTNLVCRLLLEKKKTQPTALAREMTDALILH